MIFQVTVDVVIDEANKGKSGYFRVKTFAGTRFRLPLFPIISLRQITYNFCTGPPEFRYLPL